MERRDDMAVGHKKAKRKPGGGRKKSKPDYNPSAILQNQMDATVVLYDKEEHPSLLYIFLGVLFITHLKVIFMGQKCK